MSGSSTVNHILWLIENAIQNEVYDLFMSLYDEVALVKNEKGEITGEKAYPGIVKQLQNSLANVLNRLVENKRLATMIQNVQTRIAASGGQSLLFRDCIARLFQEELLVLTGGVSREGLAAITHFCNAQGIDESIYLQNVILFAARRLRLVAWLFSRKPSLDAQSQNQLKINSILSEAMRDATRALFNHDILLKYLAASWGNRNQSLYISKHIASVQQQQPSASTGSNVSDKLLPLIQQALVQQQQTNQLILEQLSRLGESLDKWTQAFTAMSAEEPTRLQQPPDDIQKLIDAQEAQSVPKPPASRRADIAQMAASLPIIDEEDEEEKQLLRQMEAERDAPSVQSVQTSYSSVSVPRQQPTSVPALVKPLSKPIPVPKPTPVPTTIKPIPISAPTPSRPVPAPRQEPRIEHKAKPEPRPEPKPEPKPERKTEVKQQAVSKPSNLDEDAILRQQIEEMIKEQNLDLTVDEVIADLAQGMLSEEARVPIPEDDDEEEAKTSVAAAAAPAAPVASTPPLKPTSEDKKKPLTPPPPPTPPTASASSSAIVEPKTVASAQDEIDPIVASMPQGGTAPIIVPLKKKKKKLVSAGPQQPAQQEQQQQPTESEETPFGE